MGAGRRVETGTAPAAGARTVLGCTLANLVSSTPIVNATFGVFLVPLSRDLHWPRARVSLVLMVVALCCSVSYPLVGRCADRFGVRPVALVGILLFSGSVTALSLSSTVAWQTYALFALLGLTSAIPSTMLYSKLISAWYVQRRGLFLGVAAGIGNGVGSTVMPALAGAVIVSQGWRSAYQVLGLTVLIVGLPSVVLLMRAPPVRRDGPMLPAVASGETLGGAMRTRRFWILLAMMGLGAGSLTALFAHVVPMLTDRGISPSRAILTLSAFALTGSGWQLVLGHLLDRTAAPRVIAPLFVVAVAGLALLGTASATPWLVGGALLTGLGLGTEYGAMPYLVGRYFGLRSFGAICGLIYGVNVIVLGTAPFLMDLVYDRTGSYRLALDGIAGCLIVCAGLCLLLPRYGAAADAQTVGQRDATGSFARPMMRRPADSTSA